LKKRKPKRKKRIKWKKTAQWPDPLAEPLLAASGVCDAKGDI
jgi:hypothetical protein